MVFTSLSGSVGFAVLTQTARAPSAMWQKYCSRECQTKNWKEVHKLMCCEVKSELDAFNQELEIVDRTMAKEQEKNGMNLMSGCGAHASGFNILWKSTCSWSLLKAEKLLTPFLGRV